MRRFFTSLGSGFGLAFLLTGLADLLFRLQDHGSAEAIMFVTLGLLFTVAASAVRHPPK